MSVTSPNGVYIAGVGGSGGRGRSGVRSCRRFDPCSHEDVHMQSAIADRKMSREEADGYLQSLRSREHPKGLRARLRMLRTGRAREPE